MEDLMLVAQGMFVFSIVLTLALTFGPELFKDKKVEKPKKTVRHDCCSCLYFNYRNNGCGDCKRHAPVVDTESLPRHVWPSVSEFDFCGDWVLKADGEERS